MPNVITKIRAKLANFIDPIPNSVRNKIYEALLQYGFQYTQYDTNATTYVEKGYNTNPDVYAVCQMKSNEVARIPYYIKKVKDNQRKDRYQQMMMKYSPEMYLKKIIMESKAFDDGEMKLPLDMPNALQSWRELFAMYQLFMDLNGNAYFYLMSPSEGMNKGQPVQIYLLPSHLMQIVLKENVDMLGIESPIKEYILVEQNRYITFEEENVIHVKLPNPNFDLSGSHLYGQSPLRSALSAIQSSNEALHLSAKTLANGGVFGFISTKEPLLEDQAKQIKDRLIEMDNSTNRLSNLAGSSKEVVFTRISLTTDELKPFDYLEYDQKAICNVLGWDDKLLNSDDGAKYDNYKLAARRAITSGISPNLRLLEEAFNRELLPRFKGYENTVWCFDESELPEMQEDMKNLTTWLNDSLDRGVISRDEYREAIKYTMLNTPEMQTHTVSMNILSLEEALMPNDDLGAIEP